MTQAGGKGGLEPPFHRPSSTRLGEIEREIPPEFGRPGLARLHRLAAVLGTIAVVCSACGGPVDQGFADAGMDDDNPALWNIRHDITPMFGRTTSGLSPSQTSCCDPGHISRPRIFCGLRFSGWSASAGRLSLAPRSAFKAVMPLLPLTKNIMAHHVLYVQP